MLLIANFVSDLSCGENFFSVSATVSANLISSFERWALFSSLNFFEESSLSKSAEPASEAGLFLDPLVENGGIWRISELKDGPGEVS